ncbi:hypothetical protein ADEAN_000985700 [Angomonas deanei]|uniref:Uncharacterized protein n=1 Tax=Angomonas deanei TaxID=59799 RepID=A0A7G2CV77_9TRYP|nr:hypothetical protein ADEAN_000985700 [Angomonas deanei]
MIEENFALLMDNLEVGGVLLGIRRTAVEAPWFVSATLSTGKLELAIDGSLRAYGLLVYCGESAPDKVVVSDKELLEE